VPDYVEIFGAEAICEQNQIQAWPAGIRSHDPVESEEVGRVANLLRPRE
jgi:hypothetical protein